MEKKLLLIICCAFFFCTGCDEMTPVEHGVNGPYELIWSDEFNEDTLNTDNWIMETRNAGYTNNELQAYVYNENNVFLRDGKLVLKAIKKTDEEGNVTYTSGKINSKNRQDFLYGKVVVSAKVPEGRGLWPAVWMMPTNEGYYGSWPKCGEIDIMEVLGHDTSTSYSTIHYGSPHAEQQGTYTIKDGTKLSDDFHEYSVEWDPGEIRFYVDGIKTLTVNDWYTANNGLERPYPAPFNQKFYVMMNLAVGGDWPGNPDETTDFDKAELEVDYIHVYQRTSYDTVVEKPVKQFRKVKKSQNLVNNGDFTVAEDLSDEENWKFMLFNTGDGTAEIADNMLVIKPTAAGDLDYAVQLVQGNIPLYQGKKYKLTFEAKADAARDFIVCISAPDADWIRYLSDTTESVSTEWKTYTYEFTMKDKDDCNARLEFNLGNHGYTDNFYLRNVVLKRK